MIIKKITKEEFIKDVFNAFQEGDTVIWKDGYISFYGEGMNILSEYNTNQDEAYIY